ncbi:right-handed parallel beta-helix repeat-containing protein, partial [Methylosinus sp. Sm6]|uniref:right-handed parallel beta-helix repeat-containing protein n=1 Tax=Methylosinus sp. Sm6 TaxID=2866948 RepID=UPI001C98F04D|nr:right-handed parallel beta-helix repeat-containing protein [Methylosinus sp. Sm6]
MALLPKPLLFKNRETADAARMNEATQSIHDRLVAVEAYAPTVSGLLGQALAYVDGLFDTRLSDWFATSLGDGVADALKTQADRRDGLVTYSERYFQTHGIDVRLWGVIADGVTLNAIALQAVEDLAALIGADLIFPVGTVLIEERIVKRSGVSWHGQGRAESVIKHAAGVAHHLVEPETRKVNVNHFRLERICFDGNEAEIIGDKVSAVHLLRDGDPGFSFPSGGVTVRDCEFRGWSGLGFGLVITGYEDVEVSNCYFHDGGGGASLNHDLYLRRCTRVQVIGNYLYPRGFAAGIKVQGIEQRALVQGNSSTGGGIGIVVQDSYDDRIIGNSLVEAKSYAIKISVEEQPVSKFVLISDNMISRSAIAIWAARANGIVIGPNNILDCLIGMRLRDVRANVTGVRMEVTSEAVGDVRFLKFDQPGNNQIIFHSIELRNSRSSGLGVTFAENTGVIADMEHVYFESVTVYGPSDDPWIKLNPPAARPNEGDFTPEIIGGTSAGTATYSAQAGRWQRVGSRLSFQANLSWSGHDGTGVVHVAGLPLRASIALAFYPIAVYCKDFAVPSGSRIMGYVDGGSTAVMLRVINTAGAAVGLTVPASGSLHVSGEYLVSGGVRVDVPEFATMLEQWLGPAPVAWHTIFLESEGMMLVEWFEAGGAQILLRPNVPADMSINIDGSGGAPATGGAVGTIANRGTIPFSLVAPDAASRPIYTESGGYRWIAFDGAAVLWTGAAGSGPGIGIENLHIWAAYEEVVAVSHAGLLTLAPAIG